MSIPQALLRDEIPRDEAYIEVRRVHRSTPQ
jgi:hypothetical protein